MSKAILVINAGSSSIKFAVFTHSAAQRMAKTKLKKAEPLCHGEVDGIGARTCFRASSEGGTTISTQQLVADDHEQALTHILDWLQQDMSSLRFAAAGHRVVHGGADFTRPVNVDDEVLERLKALIPLAPLHQPHALQAIEVLRQRLPGLTQVACFDTAFHAGMPLRERRFALPRALWQEGVRHYGFHGLSYDYLSQVLPDYLGEAALDKVVLAHLGHGVSLCALTGGKSIATTMSFTPLDGLPMGTRSGAIDPAIVLFLLRKGMTAGEISNLLNHRSGLLGLSGVSDDMRILLDSDAADAAEAVDIFCYRICRALGSLAAAMGGLDALVFSGGIGEHAAPVRARICRASGWLGLEMDEAANETNAACISAGSSRVSAWVIATDEQKVIAKQTATVLEGESIDACG
ncbi:MAG: acetate/propionate family kinase [Lysobacterales bacterium]|jgi:acetate kinase